ncbi:response regulator [Bacillus sp. FJAT-49736]|uniref:response regulator transcription factor n=1 Tax=Bacillus sp. FJAT-49736 TaxID=2833582 RepID=UPI001BCA2982|nr:response regulator [Bacillus sp. FJAT-49736]MBS4174460.1 response regulator [Bacillus sp. FJAT-49736]MBS4175817.1 response regulator [Bacillus sp. FJAT-49736]
MRLVIVDDEMLERKALTKMIQKEMPEVKVVGEAANGRMAIDLADQLTPDIMMMDIKMPGIDGVEAVREIRKKHKHIKFIMVSAFNTFEYAKEVMQQGVKEYLLKPSKQIEVLAALSRVRQEIEEERSLQAEQQTLKESLSRALSVMETEWLSSILNDHISFEAWSELLRIEVRSGIIVIFSITEKDIPVTRQKKQFVYERLKELLKTKSECVMGPIAENKIPVLILFNTIQEKSRMKSQAIKLIRNVLAVLNDSKISLFAGMGLPFQTIEELPTSYHEALLALEQRKLQSATSYAFPSDARSEGNLPLEKEKELIDCIKMGDRHQVLQAYECYISELESQPGQKAERMLEELVIIVSRAMYDLGIQFTPMSIPQHYAYDKIMEMTRQYVFECTELVQAWRSSHMKGYLLKAREYIMEHFNKNITLEEVAEYVELSPYHFSKLFKEKYGVNFIDYVTDLRIEQAKKEMLNTNKSLKEICFNVGYKDPNYFSRVFKKKTGVAPTSYRSTKTPSS